MTMKDISEKLVSEAHIKRHLLPVGFGLLTKERKGKEIKRRNAAHSSALQIKKKREKLSRQFKRGRRHARKIQTHNCLYFKESGLYKMLLARSYYRDWNLTRAQAELVDEE